MYETIARSCAERGETIFWRNYKRLCEDFGSNPTAVARELGISSGTVTGWKSGRMPRIYALTTVVTGKGQCYFINRFLGKQNGVAQ